MSDRRMVYSTEVRHQGLKKYRLIQGYNEHVVRQKAESQREQWEEQWQRQEKKFSVQRDKERAIENALEEKLRQKEDSLKYREDQKSSAKIRTEEAEKTLRDLRGTLRHTLNVNDEVKWESLIDKAPFKERKPLLNELVPLKDKPPLENIAPLNLPIEPFQDDAKYQHPLGFFDKIFPALRRKKQAISFGLYKSDREAWEAICSESRAKRAMRIKSWSEENFRIQQENNLQRSSWLIEQSKQKILHEQRVAEWSMRRDKFLTLQAARNAEIIKSREAYMNGHPDAVSDYCEMVLSNSKYPDYFSKNWDIQYLSETRALVVEYSLPKPGDFPALKEVQYLQAKDSFKTILLSEKEIDALYEDVLYQITLRTLHELFEADAIKALDAIVFNGLVTSINKANGKEVTACIISVQAKRAEFMDIDLGNVDPKACFRSLKGIAATKLAGLAPIPPVLMIDKADRRFVDSYAVADSLSTDNNLATMDWEDFEHLIREIFEKEFSVSGGEVKVTQASRDGGVDAIAFDPDPIRGGKIVIQAKRYTQTVGVSAVRDLYGTLINEGATKGILVTTASFGPDAYDFAKGKPISLLSGNNLLSLLQKHGHEARIDLQEARVAFRSGG